MNCNLMGSIVGQVAREPGESARYHDGFGAPSFGTGRRTNEVANTAKLSEIRTDEQHVYGSSSEDSKVRFAVGGVKRPALSL